MTKEELAELRKECDDACSKEAYFLVGTTSRDWWAKRLGYTPTWDELRVWQEAYRGFQILNGR